MAPVSFHEKQFLPFASGAPTIRSLNSSHRSVAVVQYNATSHEYALQELALERFAAANAEVIASGVIECPEREAIAVAYVEDEKLYLNVVAADELLRISRSVSSSSNGSTRRTGSVNATPAAPPSSTRFELASAPTTIASVKAVSATNGASELFHGVILFHGDSMVAFGFIDVKASEPTSPPMSPPPCVRLSSEQFANFFPEFAAFSHPVLAVDTVHISQPPSVADIIGEDVNMQSWLAFGCADGFIRVFKGQVQDDCSCGPYETKDFQIDGPVTAVSLFATLNDDFTKLLLQCNLLATCAIGHAIVYEDVFGGPGATTTEVLAGSDQFDSIFSGIAADIDLDGHVELLLGTDDQQLLAYKRSMLPANTPTTSPQAVDEQPVLSNDDHMSSPSDQVEDLVPLSPSEATLVVEELITAVEAPPTDPASDTPSPSPLPTEPFTEAPHDVHTKDENEDEELREATSTWSQLTKAQWHVEAFGAIYSLAWVDLNHDGVNELLVASTTGVFIYEADALYVLHKLQSLLQLSSPTSVSEP